MYAQSHVVHWTQEYDQEEGQFMHCYVERYKNNSNSNEFK